MAIFNSYVKLPEGIELVPGTSSFSWLGIIFLDMAHQSTQLFFCSATRAEVTRLTQPPAKTMGYIYDNIQPYGGFLKWGYP